jgi:hypothetical protein
MKAFCGNGDELSSIIGLGLHEAVVNNVLRQMPFLWCFNEYGGATKIIN